MKYQGDFIPFRSWASPAVNMEKSLLQICHSSSPLLLTTHINADPDGLGALLGIWDLCKQVQPERKIFFWLPIISSLSRKLLLEWDLDKIIQNNLLKLPVNINFPEEKIVNDIELDNNYLDPIDSVTDTIKDFVSLEVNQSLDFENLDAGCYDLLLCDTQNPNIVPNLSQLLEYLAVTSKLTFNELIFLDHHIQTETSGTESFVHAHPVFQNIRDLVFPEFKATSEIILQLYAFVGLKPADNIFKILITGIITDSRRLILADSALLANLSYWFSIFSRADFSLASLIGFMDNDYSHAEAIARMKGAQRMIICQIPPIVYTITHLSSHEAAAARGILQLGADIVFAIAEGKTETRVSLRCKNSIIHKYHIHLGKLAEALAQKFENATGSGHAGAAGVNIPKNIPWTDIRRIIEKEMNKWFQTNSFS